MDCLVVDPVCLMSLIARVAAGMMDVGVYSKFCNMHRLVHVCGIISVEAPEFCKALGLLAGQQYFANLDIGLQ